MGCDTRGVVSGEGVPRCLWGGGGRFGAAGAVPGAEPRPRALSAVLSPGAARPSPGGSVPVPDPPPTSPQGTEHRGPLLVVSVSPGTPPNTELRSPGGAMESPPQGGLVVEDLGSGTLHADGHLVPGDRGGGAAFVPGEGCRSRCKSGLSLLGLHTHTHTRSTNTHVPAGTHARVRAPPARHRLYEAAPSSPLPPIPSWTNPPGAAGIPSAGIPQPRASHPRCIPGE